MLIIHNIAAKIAFFQLRFCEWSVCEFPRIAHTQTHNRHIHNTHSIVYCLCHADTNQFFANQLNSNAYFILPNDISIT